MADSVNLTRNTTNPKIINRQRRRIVLNLASSKLRAQYRREILHWLPGQRTVTSGSFIETALNASNAIHAIW